MRVDSGECKAHHGGIERYGYEKIGTVVTGCGRVLRLGAESENGISEISTAVAMSFQVLSLRGVVR
jgi:hypothetical protein